MRNPRDRATGLTAALALLAACLATLEAITPAARAADEFTNFESGQVRPVALTPSRDRLLAVNTPDGKLEVFSLDEAGTPTRSAAVDAIRSASARPRLPVQALALPELMAIARNPLPGVRARSNTTGAAQTRLVV